MDPNYHADIDESDFEVGENMSKYCMMVGSLNWLVTLGRYDIHYTTTILARHMMMPRQGHMHAMRHIFGYLHKDLGFSIDYDIKELDFSKCQVEEYNWFPLYGNAQEEMQFGMSEPKGKDVVTGGFFYSSHASCPVTHCSTTCVLLSVNGTPIRWYSKRQNCVETSIYGLEMVVGRIVVDMAVELRYNLRMLGIPVKDNTFLFGDNQSMFTNTSLPHSMLKKCHSANNYHHVREAVVASIASVIHCRIGYNLTDMGTKSLDERKHQHLLKNQYVPSAEKVGECEPDTQACSCGNTTCLMGS
eukprot:6175231-Ditylum_brightwellii.AAC.1